MDTVHYIDLSEIQKCKVVKTSRTVNYKNSSTIVIEKLELYFYPNDKNKTQILLEFYNTNSDISVLSGELQLIEKWSDTINNRLKSKT